jgi:hypothetical protein
MSFRWLAIAFDDIRDRWLMMNQILSAVEGRDSKGREGTKRREGIVRKKKEEREDLQSS